MSHLRLSLALAALAVAGLTLGPVIASAQRGSSRPVFAVLSGANEIGPGGAKGVGDANGFGAFTALRQGNQLCYAYATGNILTPVVSGVFRGPSTANGPLALGLLLPLHGDPGAAALCRSVPGAQLDAIFSEPSNHYVDVASRPLQADGSGGAIRGQLGRERTRGRSTRALVATLSGGGDKDGFGSFVAIRDDTSFCFGMTVAKIGTPRAVRIQARRSGRAVVRLRPPPMGAPGASASCITVRGALLRAIFVKPGAYEVSVRTAAYEHGALHGRLALSG